MRKDKAVFNHERPYLFTVVIVRSDRREREGEHRIHNARNFSVFSLLQEILTQQGVAIRCSRRIKSNTLSIRSQNLTRATSHLANIGFSFNVFLSPRLRASNHKCGLKVRAIEPLRLHYQQYTQKSLGSAAMMSMKIFSPSARSLWGDMIHAMPFFHSTFVLHVSSDWVWEPRMRQKSQASTFERGVLYCG